MTARDAGGDAPWLGEGRAAWLEGVDAWVRDALATRAVRVVGPLECVRDRPWSIVLRGSTQAGSVFFKAVAPGGRHEPALVAALAERWPDCVPQPLAIDPQRGWLLAPDLGRTLREELAGSEGVAIWTDLLPRYAQIQIESARDPRRWLALGLPDRRLERLPGLVEALLDDDARVCAGQPDGLEAEHRSAGRSRLVALEECCRALAELPLCATIEHGDLHDGNVLVGSGRIWLFDWADSVVSHPFCSLLVTCNTLSATSDRFGRRGVERLRDAYLEPWSAHAPTATLRSLFPLGLWVGHVLRALDWDHMLAGTSPAARAEWQPRVAAWLRVWLERERDLRAGELALRPFSEGASRQVGVSEQDKANEEGAAARGAGSAVRAAIRSHPVITAVMVSCTLLGAALGFFFLTDDWTAARRIAGGAIGGAGVGFLLTATRMMGAWS